MNRLLEFVLALATGSRAQAEGLLGDIAEENSIPGTTNALSVGAVLAALTVAATFAVARITRPVHRDLPRPGSRDAMMTVLTQELRSALRLPWRAPGFATAAVLTLALGIGANTAIFSLVNAVVLRPLPFPDSEQLVRVWPGEAMTKGWVMAFENTESFSALAGVSWASATLSGTGRPIELRGGEVSEQFFAVTGVAPAHGRHFAAEDHAVGAEPTVLLSHELWMRAFGGDTSVVGQLVELADDDVGQRRVVGVMPAGYQPLYAQWEFWTPVVIDPQWDYPGSQMSATAWNMVGRLRDEATIDSATAEVAVIGAQIQESAPDRMAESALARAVTVPLLADMVDDERQPLILMLGAVALLLLIACTNVANLLLARGEARRRELSIRSALGASRRRLAAQLLSESLVLALLGGALGVAAAYGAIHYFRRDLINLMPRGGEVALDVNTLLFALAVSVLASVIFGMLPAIRAQRPTADARHGDSSEQRRANRVLVAVEVALAIVFLAGAGLMLRTLSAFGDVDPGFDTNGVVAVGVNAVGDNYDDPYALHGFFVEVEEEVAAIPGIPAPAFAMSLPFGDGSWGWNYTIDSDSYAEGAPMPNAGFRVVSTSYFDTLGIPLLAGRLLDADDVHGAEEVVVVNDAFARPHFERAEDAVGRVITLNTDDSFRIVGVVQGIRHLGFRSDPVPEMYRSFNQHPTRMRHVVARTAMDAESLGEAIQAVVWDIDPDVPVRDAITMDEIMRTSVHEARLFAQLLSAFAALGAVLAGIGVYGVVAYTVSRSRRALAIRMALGASASSVIRRSLREALAPVAVGAVAGLAGAAAAGELLASLLFGVTPRDPVTPAAVPLLLIALASAAAWLPSRRAARVDPAEVLRQE